MALRTIMEPLSFFKDDTVSLQLLDIVELSFLHRMYVLVEVR